MKAVLGTTQSATESTVTAEEFERELLPNLPALMGVANRLARSRSEAEDLLQDTCVKAFRSRDQYRPGTNLRAWLIAILRNTFLNGYRRRALERRTLEAPEASPLTSGWIGASTLRALRDPSSDALEPLLERPLLDAIDALPPDFRVVVLLADVEELSYREIADSLGCPIGTVMSRLHRARRILRSRLVEHARALGLAGADDVETRPALTEPATRDTPQAQPGGSPDAEAVAAPVNLERYRSGKGAR